MSECWIYAGQFNSYGYGVVNIGFDKFMAHRAVYETEVGEIPEGLDLDHLCRVRACVNPEHLEPVTRRENLLRGETIAAKHAAKTHCAQGHELSGPNLRTTPNRPNTRICRTCDNKRRLARYHKFKQGVLK